VSDLSGGTIWRVALRLSPEADGGGGGGGQSGEELLGGAAQSSSKMASPAMVRRRGASVQLRATETGVSAEDQANRALGQALRYVYVSLLLGMSVLVAVFLLSGFQSIREGERGLRVLLGRVVADDLKPGFQWALPRPLGEIVTIDIGNKTLDVREPFWPNQSGSPDQRWADESVLANTGRGKLDPVQDGMLLLGDLSIGHATVKVEYVRDAERVKEFARNIHPDSEAMLIRGAVMQAVVRASAGVTIDQFRKDLDLQRRAQATAQQLLDRVGAGIRVQSLVLERRMVPTNLIRTFNEVDNAIAKSAEEINKAQQERQGRLSRAAGEGAEDLLALIDAYDRELSGGQVEASEATLAEIDRLLDGGAVASGQRPGARVTGEVSRVLAEARAEQTRLVATAQSDARNFAVKLDNYKTNPAVVLVSDWTEAVGRFRSRETVQSFSVPRTTRTLDLLLNRDPAVVKELERRRNEAETQRRQEAELRRAQEAGLASPTP
jgi:regulator of protease activity HflC (stomatin/prohibitin superfamily)